MKKRTFEGSDPVSGLDESGSSSSIQPPAKRILMDPPYKDPSSGMVEEEGDNDLPDLLKDKVLAFQKQAIWLQMNEYKRLCASHEATIDSLQTQLASRQSVAELLISYTNSLSHIISSMTGSSDPSSSSSSPLPELYKFFHIEIPQLESSLQNTLDTIQKGVDSILKSSHLSADMSHLHSLSAQNASLKVKIDSLTSHIAELEDQLQTSRQKTTHFEKKMDRLKLERTASVNSLNRDPMESASTESAILSKEGEANATVPEIKFIEVQKMAESRLNEITLLKNERMALQQEMSRLKIQLEDERLSHSAASFSELEKQLDFRVKEHKRIQSGFDVVVAELQALKEERRLFLDQVKSNELKERKVLEEAIKKLESDLQRVRSNRDAIQKSLESKKAQEENLRKSYSELKALSSTRKDMIQCLQVDVTRLKSAIAAEMGEKALLDFFNESQENPYSALRSQLESLKKKSAALEEQVEAAKANLKSSSSEESVQVDPIAVYAQWDETRSRLETQLESYKKLFGDVDTLAPDVQSQLEQMKATVDDLDTKLEYHRKTESALLAEIETIGKAWADLEKQCASQIQTIQEKEEQIHRLLAEKAKYEQKFATLSKQNATLNGTCSALKKQSDRQLEQIRKLEEAERNLSQQLQVLAKDNAAQEPIIEREKQHSFELRDKLEQVQHQCVQLTQKMDHVSLLVKAKTDQVEQEADLRRRTQEAADILKRKLDFLQSKESPADALLQKQVEEYRLLLKCQSCNTNFKSHTLLKCMHTFCKSCIDDMYSSRQRKCPACGVAFGLQDIKQVYL